MRWIEIWLIPTNAYTRMNAAVTAAHASGDRKTPLSIAASVATLPPHTTPATTRSTPPSSGSRDCTTPTSGLLTRRQTVPATPATAAMPTHDARAASVPPRIQFPTATIATGVTTRKTSRTRPMTPSRAATRHHAATRHDGSAEIPSTNTPTPASSRPGSHSSAGTSSRLGRSPSSRSTGCTASLPMTRPSGHASAYTSAASTTTLKRT